MDRIHALIHTPEDRAPFCLLQANIPPEAPLEVAPPHAPVNRLPKPSGQGSSSFEVTGAMGATPGGPGKVTL